MQKIAALKKAEDPEKTMGRSWIPRAKIAGISGKEPDRSRGSEEVAGESPSL